MRTKVGRVNLVDYPIQGSDGQSITMKRVDDYTIGWTVKKDGIVIVSGKTVYSRDGKLRTNIWSTTADGRKRDNVAVFERQ